MESVRIPRIPIYSSLIDNTSDWKTLAENLEMSSVLKFYQSFMFYAEATVQGRPKS